MSLAKIESGGNQVKDSLTQLTETIQKSQTQFATTLNNSFKDNEKQNKKVDDQKASGSEKSSNETQPIKNIQEQQTKSDNNTSNDASSSQNSQTTSAEESQNNHDSLDSNDNSKAQEEVFEQTINQSDLLLLSLLITPNTQAKPVETQATEEISDMCVKTQQQEKSKDSESIVNHSQDLTLNNTAQDTLPLPTQDVKSTTHNQKPQKTFSESSKKEESSEDISQLLKSKTDQKDEKSEGITPVNTQALPEVKETVASDNLSITPKEKKQEVVMTMNKNVDKDISQLNTPSETQDVKKRPLKIDDLIFELRHPEVVLQRAQSQDQDNDLKVKADVLATRNMEKVQSIQNQFLSAMKTIVDRHEEKMIIHLDPPEWGKIDVQLKLQNKELNVQIRTEQAFVKESLEKGVPELRQAFSGQGLQLGHLNIGMGQQMDREQNQQNEQNLDNQQKQTVIKTQNTNKPRWRNPNSIVDRIV